MNIPFQRLLYCPRNGHRELSIIFAAAGSVIHSFSASDGTYLSKWSYMTKEAIGNLLDKPESLGHRAEIDDLDVPRKRRKVSSGEDVPESLTEIVTERDVASPEKSRQKTMPVASIIKLCGTSDGKHVVAITGQDKCVRVLNILEDGSLVQLSERHMPKRPSSVILNTDQSTILCADKFGDVYALPLLGPSSRKQSVGNATRSLSDGLSDGVPEEKKVHVPSASVLTVHTKKNQQALKNQMKTAHKVAEKKTLDFDHQLLLGHVSLLTDLAYVTLPQDGSETSQRSYILSSDRDEHIRVSRGLPQCHIIEGYCLGHTQFISKICIIPWHPKYLVSGGGDDYLFVWDWLPGDVQEKINLKPLVADLRLDGAVKPLETNGSESREDLASEGAVDASNIAVSGIWAVPTPNQGSGELTGDIVVAVEGLPALLIYSIDSKGKLVRSAGHKVDGNVLDVTICEDYNSILCTMDNVHKPFSKTELDSQQGRPSTDSFSYCTISQSWRKAGYFGHVMAGINDWASSNLSQPLDTANTLSAELYSVEMLRKRGQEEQ